MLRPGFEPGSRPRKGRMIGRTTPSEQKWARGDLNPRPLVILVVCLERGHIRPALHQAKLRARKPPVLISFF